MGEIEPLYYREVIWPVGEEKYKQTSTRGIFVAHLKDPNRVEFYLQKRIKCKAEHQGELNYPLGFEIEIQKDDLGIYSRSKQVFLAASTSSRFMADEVITYSAEEDTLASNPWGNLGRKDGFCMRLIFFGDEPGLSIGLGSDPKDRLIFKGFENVPTTNEAALHFRREVDASENASEDLDRAFTEDTWFVKGKGLVYFQQKINDKISMTWELVDFKKGF